MKGENAVYEVNVCGICNWYCDCVSVLENINKNDIHRFITLFPKGFQGTGQKNNHDFF